MELDRIYENRFPAEDRDAKDAVWRVLCRHFFQRYVGTGRYRARSRRRVLRVPPAHPVRRSHRGGSESRSAAVRPTRDADRRSPEPRARSERRRRHRRRRVRQQLLRAPARQVHAPVDAVGDRACCGRADGSSCCSRTCALSERRTWDFIDHHIALTDRSLAEAVGLSGLRVTSSCPASCRTRRAAGPPASDAGAALPPLPSAVVDNGRPGVAGGDEAQRRGTLIMATALVTGSAGLIGSEMVRALLPRGHGVVGIDNDMRGRFFGAEASTRCERASLARAARLPPPRCRHPRRAGARAAVRRARRRTSRSSSTPRRSRRTTGRRAIRCSTSTSTPPARSSLLELTRRHAPEAAFVFTSRTRCTATRRTGCRCVELDDALGDRSRASVRGRHRRDDVGRSDACTRCSARRRSRPTCWCRSTAATSASEPAAFRGGCLTGPAPLRRGAPRLSRLPR